MVDALGHEGYQRGKARTFATIVPAGLRGFTLDFCVTRDRKRLDRAVYSQLETPTRTIALRIL